ncbi:MAG TPA: metallopeptidase TldD-related protein [Acidothermaceae bacterium]|nr:metallopeptidase TldD-related protein [Acidothermaceae bacterium]
MSDVTPQDTIEHTLELAARVNDVSGCVVIADESSSANLRWANNTLTTNGVTRGRRLTVVATVNGAQGVAAGVVSRSAVRSTDLDDLVNAAVAAARDNTPAQDAGPLVEPHQSSMSWDDVPAETSGGVFEDFTRALGEELARADRERRLLFGYAEHDMTSTYMGSSTGLRLRHDQPTGQLEMNAKSGDFARSAWGGAATRDFTDVDVAGLHGDLAQRLDWANRRVDLPPGRYDTVLPPTAVADLMIYLYWSAGARDAHDGRTVFSKAGGGTRVGETLTSSDITLRSDPKAAQLECGPFVVAHTSSAESSVFDNGLGLRSTAWIESGRLASLIQTRYSANLTGLPTTPAIDNLILERAGGGPSLDDMVATSKRSLLVTCLWYIREVDPQTLLLTGLTRDGVYLVEDGEVVGAVNNFRFNESPVDLLRRATDVGETVRCLPREWNDYFTRTAMPAMRVPDFNMSTVSQAS